MPGRPPLEKDEQAAAHEQFDPDSPSVGLLDAEHLARYWWAAQAVSGKEVLDAGCGVGHGARILADAGAKRVTGVALSEDAQSEAVRRAGDVAGFVAGRLEALPFAPASFDIAVCFDATDRSEQRSELLEELHRVLRENGSLLLASASPDGLERELASRFATVALHRQHPRLASAILADGLSDGEAMLTVRAIAPLDSFQAPVTLAVASKREAPALADVVALGDPFEARSWEDRVDCARRETDEALRRLEQAREGERHLSAERDLLARRLIEAEQARARSLSLEDPKSRRGDDGTSGRKAAILALGTTVSPRMNAVRSAAKTLLGLRR